MGTVTAAATAVLAASNATPFITWRRVRRGRACLGVRLAIAITVSMSDGGGQAPGAGESVSWGRLMFHVCHTPADYATALSMRLPSCDLH